MKQRNPIVVALASIFSLGIYALVWFASTRKVLTKATGKAIPGVWMLAVAFVVTYPVLFVGLVVFMLHQSPHNQDNPRTFLYLLGAQWLAMLVLSVVHIYWFLKYAKAVDIYTNGKMNTALSFVLLYLLGAIGMAVIQDTYNTQLANTSAAENKA